MALVFAIWAVGALSAALGVYVTLHPTRSRRKKTWCWITFAVLTVFAGEIAFYQKIDQDNKDDDQKQLSGYLRDSNKTLSSEIHSFSSKLEKLLPPEGVGPTKGLNEKLDQLGAVIKDLQSQVHHPRTLTAEQKDKFQLLMDGKPKGPVRVMSISTSNEVKEYVNEIRSMLEDNGCGLPPGSPVRIVMGDVSISNDTDGTDILVRSSKDAPQYAVAVQQAFKAIGVPMDGIEVPREQNVVLPGEVVIFVTDRR